ncbi:hypothetical protein [Pantoea sp. BAV 3049]|uniref:hypothetical protein n=1 Tax=Pantoea sp. BAV 3049 TaxID=2654188 RepID=UPI00131DB487|nr:hypothetical protein [Pantoea sp. BAV 3049]
MQIIPKLTHQRLAELTPGTPIRLGSKLVTFDGCSVRPNYKGLDEIFVEYVDSDGNRMTHCEFTVLQCATEFTDAVMCKYCGKFRQPDDIIRKTIRFWNRSEYHEFCADAECGRRYQESIRVPSQQRARTTRIRTS